MIQIGGVTLGNACRARDKCRQAAANGLVNAQTIAIIMSRANQRIGGGENVADLPHETQNMDTARRSAWRALCFRQAFRKRKLTDAWPSRLFQAACTACTQLISGQAQFPPLTMMRAPCRERTRATRRPCQANIGADRV